MYALCLGYRIRYVLDLNAREAMQLIELRSGREGHPSYRAVAHEMHRQIAEVHPPSPPPCATSTPTPSPAWSASSRRCARRRSWTRWLDLSPPFRPNPGVQTTRHSGGSASTLRPHSPLTRENRI